MFYTNTVNVSNGVVTFYMSGNVLNEVAYKQEICLMYVSREVLLHKSKFVKRGEGSVCSFLPVAYFICNYGGLLIF